MDSSKVTSVRPLICQASSEGMPQALCTADKSDGLAGFQQWHARAAGHAFDHLQHCCHARRHHNVQRHAEAVPGGMLLNLQPCNGACCMPRANCVPHLKSSFYLCRTLVSGVNQTCLSWMRSCWLHAHCSGLRAPSKGSARACRSKHCEGRCGILFLLLLSGGGAG